MDSNTARSRYSYDAFLSFRGADIRYEFANSVHDKLVQAGLRTFLDEEDVDTGEKFDTVIRKAINESKIAVFIFSKDFASSTYCLEEVAMFMALWRRKEAGVLPVFYKVEPDPRWAEDGGVYSGSFKNHEQDLEKRFLREEEELANKLDLAALKKDLGEVSEIGFRREEEELTKKKSQLVETYQKMKQELADWKKDLGEVAEITGHHRMAEAAGDPCIAEITIDPRIAEITGHHRMAEATGDPCIAEITVDPRIVQITGHLHVYKEKQHVTDFINKVVKDAWRLANPVILDVPRQVIGRQDRFSELERWVQDKDHEKRIALLHGPKGIGKATIAAVVSNDNYREFDAAVFVGKVEDKCKQPGGIATLQGQLFDRITNFKGSTGMLSELEGRGRIRKALNEKRVLIVLADLDQGHHLSELIGEPGSIDGEVKVIVTSGDKNLLTDVSCVKFHVGPLTKQQSLELFRWEACEKRIEIAEDEGDEMVDDALKYCGWNPLLIKAFVSCLSYLSINSKDALSAELKRIYRINQKARFECLGEDDKKLFFDIACFYADRDHDHVHSALNNSDHDLCAVAGFERLRGLHWVSVDANRRVTMDQPVKDMGRYMVRENAHTLEERSHIWSLGDASNLLRRCNGTGRTRSFILKGKQVETSSSATKMEFETRALAGMTGLKLLQLVSVKLRGDYEHFPEDLVWLSWEGMPGHRILTDSSWKDLVSLDWYNGSLQKFFNQKRLLEKLKILNLSRCHSLKRTPDFTCLLVPNLERLILENCIFLEEIDPSIEEVASLVQLDLKGCRSLEELPMLGSGVKLLDISLCTGMRSMPNGRIESIEQLCADQIVAVDQLWAEPEPAGFSFSAIFPRLVKLSLVDCKLSDENITQITRDLVNLPSLTDLDLSLNLLTCVPEGLRSHPSLRVRI